MIFKKAPKKLYFFIPVLLAAVTVFFFVSPIDFGNMAVSTQDTGGIKLSGFSAGTKINYRAVAGEGSSMDGTVVVGNEGQAELPPLRLQKENPLGLDYIMSIQSPSREPGKPVEIAVRLDDKTGALSLKGSGFERFTDVRLTGKETQNIKTDWAGIFELPHAATIDELEGRGSLKLAFNNMGAISDAAPKQSSIVEVQILLIPGVGGGPTSLGVNTYNPTGCDGETEHSICDEDHIDRTIEDIVEFVVLPMLMMGEQLSAVMLYHTQLIGHLLDAKIQLETQSKHQELRAEALKDYHPSDMMCRFGSFVKSVSHTEQKSQQNKLALNKILADRYTNKQYQSSLEGADVDIEARLEQFRRVYCDPFDNNNGLRAMCDHDGDLSGGNVGGTDRERMNKDINFTRTVEIPLTLDIDFTDPASEPDEEDVVALAKNLYWPTPLPYVPQQILAAEEEYQKYLAARHHIAMRSVAHNSFISLIGDKSRSVDAIGADSGWAYMKAMMREFGIADAEIHELLGDTPSYYAQMDVLMKKIYQHPQFYTNLYDKPANVGRISAAMDAVALMHSRDRFESALRREMLASLLVENQLQKHQEAINVDLFSGMKVPQN